MCVLSGPELWVPVLHTTFPRKKILRFAWLVQVIIISRYLSTSYSFLLAALGNNAVLIRS